MLLFQAGRRTRTVRGRKSSMSPLEAVKRRRLRPRVPHDGSSTQSRAPPARAAWRLHPMPVTTHGLERTLRSVRWPGRLRGREAGIEGRISADDGIRPVQQPMQRDGRMIGGCAGSGKCPAQRLADPTRGEPAPRRFAAAVPHGARRALHRTGRWQVFRQRVQPRSRPSTASRKPCMSTSVSLTGSVVLPLRSPVTMPSPTVSMSAALSRFE